MTISEPLASGPDEHPVPPPAEPVPWAAGLTVACWSAVLALVAIIAFGLALAGIHPALALLINVVGVGGAAPTVWGWRELPIVRWCVYGAFAGVAAGWACLLVAGLASVLA